MFPVVMLSPGVETVKVWGWSLALCMCCMVQPALALNFATSVVSYNPGDSPAMGFTNPTAALGPPTRVTSPGNPQGGAVTPFQPAFGTDEVVSLGAGGSLVLRFARRVYDHATPDAFGMELIVFGNSFLTGSPDLVTGLAAEPGTIELSQDGVSWRSVSTAADAAYPTLGFVDLEDPFSSEAGTIPSDFGRPVDPTLEVVGLSFSEIVNAYAGSGGGAAVDVGETGLPWIQFIRLSNPHTVSSGITPEIDAVTLVSPHLPWYPGEPKIATNPSVLSAVPEGGAPPCPILLFAGWILARRDHRRIPKCADVVMRVL